MTRINLRSLRQAGAGAATLLLVSGCMTATLEESRNTSTAIQAHEAVVLLAKPHVEGITAEDDFMDCVGNKMSKQTGIQVVANDKFVDSMFPWLEPSTAPQRPEGVTKLLRATRSRSSRKRRALSDLGGWRHSPDRSGGSITCTIGRPVAVASDLAGGKRSPTTRPCSGTSIPRRPRVFGSTNVTGTSRSLASWFRCLSLRGCRARPVIAWPPSGAFLRGDDPSMVPEGS